MTHSKALIIDDEPDIRELLSMTFDRMKIKADFAENVQAGINDIKKNDYFLVLTDMKMPDGSGLDIVRFIQAHKPKTPVAVITAFGNVESAVETLKAGAFDYVSKPIDLSMLKSLVQTALNFVDEPHARDDIIIGNSDCMLSLKEKIQKVARSQAPVYISGESGVGKELVARYIHASGPRASKPFIAVNCGAIPTELVESEFFGHTKGSFTGAVSDKKGLFQAAHGGTLLLDEIAELALPMQIKLLRAIQEKAIRPVGEVNEIGVDVRILSASNQDLVKKIEQNEFRQELYYRINVIELLVPPLRKRKSDIPALAENILKKISHAHQTEKVGISQASLNVLKDYEFPGNVRELENILERAVALSNNFCIEPFDLHLPNAINKQTDNHLEDDMMSIESSKNLDKALEEKEKQIILDALTQTKWNRTAAAKKLGISFRTLRYRLKKFNLD